MAKSDPTNELGAAVDGIRGRFLARLGDQTVEMAKQLRAVEEQRSEADSLHEIQAIAHKIAGLAQTLGYPNLGGMAAKVDASLNSTVAVDLSAEDRADQVAEIREFIELCKGVFETRKEM